MFENIKTKIQENPERAKKAGIVAGAVVGLTAASVLLYLNRDRIEFPTLGEDLPTIEPAVELD